MKCDLVSFKIENVALYRENDTTNDASMQQDAEI
jgi:hypothetical protein